jgi:hypothetical protein
MNKAPPNIERDDFLLSIRRVLSRICSPNLRGGLIATASFRENRAAISKAALAYIVTQASLDASRLAHKQSKAPKALYALNLAAKTAIFRNGK